jgi:hypothetical protein
MEQTGSFEMLVPIYEITQHYIPEDQYYKWQQLSDILG